MFNDNRFAVQRPKSDMGFGRGGGNEERKGRWSDDLMILGDNL